MSNILEMAIERAMLGFPPGSIHEPDTMQMFELVLERAILGMPSAPRHGPPDYTYLLYRRDGALNPWNPLERP